ncbi:hypothetical protein N2152v2_005425 [Parachlorella kessleri]
MNTWAELHICLEKADQARHFAVWLARHGAQLQKLSLHTVSRLLSAGGQMPSQSPKLDRWLAQHAQGSINEQVSQALTRLAGSPLVELRWRTAGDVAITSWVQDLPQLHSLDVATATGSISVTTHLAWAASLCHLSFASASAEHPVQLHVLPPLLASLAVQHPAPTLVRDLAGVVGSVGPHNKKGAPGRLRQLMLVEPAGMHSAIDLRGLGQVAGELTSLSLVKCRLDQLPPQVGEVTALRELAIEQNWGMVPSSLGLERLAALRQLTFLSLRNCRLASLPRGAAMLTGLHHLDLALNDLNHAPLGCGLEHLSALTALTSISLLGCRLQGLPAAVLTLPKLEFLSLAGVASCGPLPLPAAACPLKTLELELGVAASSADTLAQLTSLSKLCLSVGPLEVLLGGAKPMLPSTAGQAALLEALEAMQLGAVRLCYGLQ